MSNKSHKYKLINPLIAEIASTHNNSPETVVEVMREIMSREGVLDREAITDIARCLHIPIVKAFGVATFYSMLNTGERGEISRQTNNLKICDGPVCWMQRGDQLRKAAADIFENNLDWTIQRTSCLGLCDRAPAALVNDLQAGPLRSEQIGELAKGWHGRLTDYSQSRRGEIRIMLSNTGKVDPESVDSALQHGAYLGLQAALSRHPGEVVSEVEESGLTGRGGAGFLVGRKWRFVAQESRSPKYVICNADESEPLIFKDRVLIETNPHQILEGIAIAGYATGASQAFIYIRGEYEKQAQLLEQAIHQAESIGWLGSDIQGSGFSFDIHVHRGAGAYICGEETALIESLEGKRGEPRLRPPYPPSRGYHNLPTLVNNVESFAAVPAILCNGANWHRSLSNWSTPGTKLYMLLGHVKQPGLFEAPFGITLRQAIDHFGGGMQDGSEFHFALTGGAAGTIVPPDLLDQPIDYTSAAKGVSLGAGAFLICDKSISPVDILRQLLHFFAIESCGKCTPCRVGTSRGLEILNKIGGGHGQQQDVDELRHLADVMQVSSFCGLGQSVAIPVKSALTHFESLFINAN